MEVGIKEILVGLIAVFSILYWYLTKNFNYWKKLKVHGPEPHSLFGNFKDVILGKAHSAITVKQIYDEYRTEQLVGIYLRGSPYLIVRDPDLIKNILIKDFNVFPDRLPAPKFKSDPTSPNLVNLEHERWRPLRNKLSPVFTSGKLKDMFYLITECADHLEKYVEKLVKEGKPIECRDLTAKFTTDSIGACAFGLNTNTLQDEDSEFRKHGRDLFSPTYRSTLRRLLQEYSPKIYDLLSPWLVGSGTNFFVRTIKETLAYREENKVRRNDFVDLLLDLQKEPEITKDFKFDDQALIAQAIVFFAAGFETSSTTMSNILYELALNPDVQDKLREEIVAGVKNDNGKFTYDNIKNMKYLDKVMKEALRKYPPGATLQRISAAPYTFEGTKVTVPRGTRVFVPVWALHRDADYFPDPDKFIPERFLNPEVEKSITFLPFGNGPHNCIGMRFAEFQTKVGAAALIKNFKVQKCEETCIPYRIVPRAIVPTPIGGIVLKLTKA